MSEQDNSPEISANSPKSPSTPEKRFSLSKLIENIVLFIAGAAFTISLFSKNKNTETKELHKDNQKEIKESHEKAGQSQEVKNKEIKSPLSKSRITNRLGDLHSNASRKICLKLRKKITKDKLKDMLKKLGIAMGASFMVFIASWITTGHWRDILNGVYPIFKYLFSDNIPLGISISLAIIVAFSMLFGKGIVTCSQKGISSLTNRYFMFTLATLAILGASSALLVPSYTNLFREPGYTSAQQDSAKEPPEKVQNTPTPTPSSTGNKAAEVEQKSTSDLRLHLLYITGGIIAILGLIETNRKNSQDHIRQVHATRRDRYIEAVDKLSSEHAPVRLGGVYALAGLVDEWLDDDNIDEKTRFKEGQIIINNLCSYIRSPFPAAEKIEEYESRDELKNLKSKKPKNLSEEESLRFKVLNERFKKSGAYNSPENISSVYTELREEQDVRRAIFVEMSNRGSTFTTDKNDELNIVSGPWSDFDYNFSHALIFYSLNNITIEKGNFSGAKFCNNIDFSQVFFPTKADFNKTTFYNEAVFQAATFNEAAEFNRVTFNDMVHFVGVTFNDEALFYTTGFNNNAYFSGADFNKGAYFYTTTFTGKAIFHNATFKNQVDFGTVTFNEEADFVGAIFTGQADFSDATFVDKSPSFALIIEELDIVFRAQFAILPESERGHDFTVSKGSRPIPVKKVNLNDIKRYIPIGAVLFDPDSGRKSNPAK